jgi:hypothetical protein
MQLVVRSPADHAPSNRGAAAAGVGVTHPRYPGREA